MVRILLGYARYSAYLHRRRYRRHASQGKEGSEAIAAAADRGWSSGAEDASGGDGKHGGAINLLLDMEKMCGVHMQAKAKANHVLTSPYATYLRHHRA